MPDDDEGRASAPLVFRVSPGIVAQGRAEVDDEVVRSRDG